MLINSQIRAQKFTNYPLDLGAAPEFMIRLSEKRENDETETNFTPGLLKGTAAGALGMAAAGLLGGCANDNSNAATAATPTPTDIPQNSATDWLGSAPVIDESQIVATYDCDVVVIGAGTAGLFAALRGSGGRRQHDLS